MNEHLTQKIRNDFDRIALTEQVKWDHNNHYHDFLLKQLPSQCKSVLEIGCGTGEFSRRLAKCSERVVALDLSPNMIKVASRRSLEHLNIDFHVADAMKWKFPVEQFDAIVSIATVHHLSLEDLLPSLKAALKPGGKLIILDLLEYENLQERLSDLIAVPLNWIFLMLTNRQIKPSLEAQAAMKEHMRTDSYLTLSQANQIYQRTCVGTQIRKHLFWRYSAVWEKET